MIRRTLAGLACVILTACPSDPEETEPTWQTVQEDLDGALLRVWGTSANDVYAVGSDPKDEGSLMIHFDGTKWTKLDTGTTGDLWWIDRVAPDELRIVGEGGIILKYTPSTGAFERKTAPSETTLFGCFGRSANDVWYIGGVSPDRGVVWHDDGTSITAISDVGTATVGAIFKVHGFADGTVWIVGDGGFTARWDGARFQAFDTGITSTLFTVHGASADRVFAVGGFGQGEILAFDGSAWVRESPELIGQMNGVWALDGERAYAAGFNGNILERKNGTWSEVQGNQETLKDLHSIFVDDAGGIWAAGGQIAANPPRDGVLVYFGRKIAAGL